MKIAFATLGCKVNQFETQALTLCAKERGHTVCDFSESAEAYVINTCSVTAVSDKKSRQLIRKTARAHPQALIAVCGCFAQTHPEAAVAIEGVDVVSGTGDKHGFLDLIERAAREKTALCSVDAALRRREFEVLPAGGLPGHTRAMLKVQDGCVNFCSYCIIPYARGPVRSMPFDAALHEVARLQAAGYREIVITGIEISSYGVDLAPARSLVDLVAAICEAAQDVRSRLGSLEPRTVDAEFCARLSGYSSLCPQFHLSLQSGCDATLARMRRKYDSARYFESVTLLRAAFPNCAITTDLIVGFPGETEEEFTQTLAFIRRCEFAMMHIFPYSRREGTPAATMLGQIAKSEKERRAAQAAELAKAMRAEYLQKQVGRSLRVLFEECEDGAWQGHAENYALVRVRSEEELKNRVLPVRIGGAAAEYLTGTIGDF